MVNNINFFLMFVTVMVFCFICHEDIIRRRIPNSQILLVFMLLLIDMFMLERDFNYVFLMFMIVFMLFLYSLGGIGGGDIKLMISISPFVPTGCELLFFQIVAFWGGVIAIVFKLWALQKDNKEKVFLPYGLAISLGFITCFILTV